jgi:2-polyprenyl-3-methyl-5-hydroxy-6-metoxy-1,4-benzoquinol methylase
MSHRETAHMNIRSIIVNPLVEDVSSVLLLKDHREFEYSDGAQSERYLDQVFRNATDLGSQSSELASFIKDWPSEYHLSLKRAQLLAGFTFDRSLKVLEVGCGCGAITRILGESFDQVVSVEGSMPRARLARSRTRDLPSVNVVCAPFQKIEFSQKFDIIFCIGVFEYSGSFVEADDPYDAVLKYFSSLLTPDGMVVIAIENQFGLKYINGCSEDHIGVPYEGIEGYHRRPRNVRTFGKHELEDILKPYFPSVLCYYPYPDYKLPDAVLASAFVASGQAGELISQLHSRDYAPSGHPQWDEAATALELSRNRMLEHLANSFLFVAGRGRIHGIAFEQRGILFASSRNRRFTTETRIVEGADQRLRVIKRARHKQDLPDNDPLRLIDTDGPWIDGVSLQTEMALKAMSARASLEDIFAPAKTWITHISAEAVDRGGAAYLPGNHIDSIWPNAYRTGDACTIIDREWVWRDEIPLNALVIRAVYDFLAKIEGKRHANTALAERSGRSLITKVATVLGVQLRPQDFEAFITLESEIQWLVFGVDKSRQATFLRWYLSDRPTLQQFRRSKQHATRLANRVRAKLGGLG